MENRSTSYWDGWLSQSRGAAAAENPYSARTQGSSNRQWAEGYWARHDAERTMIPDHLSEEDWYALNGVSY